MGFYSWGERDAQGREGVIWDLIILFDLGFGGVDRGIIRVKRVGFRVKRVAGWDGLGYVIGGLGLVWWDG